MLAACNTATDTARAHSAPATQDRYQQLMHTIYGIRHPLESSFKDFFFAHHLTDATTASNTESNNVLPLQNKHPASLVC